ncbi:MAG: abortive infection family protein [Alphaproteobacteria bacterium]|nr:abortive infection family protein [Alphaproteobacteria bacterium]MBU0794241.1 abortive infection family protein [Alphaproteobacteria bacterium]MBU0876599.1 abortive infection family protein [Alphaproteobacteria bacterium]MBU1769300.1 abortive infection family protein [Alphaproteobacteria bacterium]
MEGQDDEAHLAAVEAMLAAEGMTEAAELLREADCETTETGWDNWNGGTPIYTLFLSIDPAHYGRLGAKRATLEEQITARVKAVYERDGDIWFSASIRPRIQARPDWRSAPANVSRRARRNIIDGLKVDNIAWMGSLDDVEFLQRLWDLETLPSHDSRYKDAAGDIWQHRWNNNDWEDDWIFEDKRFDLIDGPADRFLAFLAEMVHPVVRPDRNQALDMVRNFNDQLRPEGWMLVEVEKIAGRPRFVVKAIGELGGRSVMRARTVADALDAAWMHREIERLENAVDRDPALAIGTAKELVESCCKSVLTKRGISYSASADLPALTKLVAKELGLVPDDITDAARGAETIRLILRNLSALTQYLAELRSLYGSGHGRDGQHRGLQPRHARLAVGAAVSFIDFVTETFRERKFKEEVECSAAPDNQQQSKRAGGLSV